MFECRIGDNFFLILLFSNMSNVNILYFYDEKVIVFMFIFCEYATNSIKIGK